MSQVFFISKGGFYLWSTRNGPLTQMYPGLGLPKSLLYKTTSDRVGLFTTSVQRSHYGFQLDSFCVVHRCFRFSCISVNILISYQPFVYKNLKKNKIVWGI